MKAAPLFLLGLLAALGAPGSAHADTAATVNYIVSLGGANIASAEVRLEDNGRRYSLDLKADVTGLGQLVASGTATAESAGTIGRDGLASQAFDLLTRANGEDFSISIEYAAGDVTKFVVDPPLLDNIDRVPLERKDLHGVKDMLAAFVLRANALSPAVCNRRMQVFTGVERFDLVMRYAQDDVATSPRTGYQGPVVLCKIRYVPVSGHFTTSEMTSFLAKSDRILIWYAPLGTTGYMIPYRVVVGTSMGDLSMVLTAAKS